MGCGGGRGVRSRSILLSPRRHLQQRPAADLRKTPLRPWALGKQARNPSKVVKSFGRSLGEIPRGTIVKAAEIVKSFQKT
jgi:hypothetical protein